MTLPTKEIIALGAGRFVINYGTHEGKQAVYIERAPSPGPVGSNANDALPRDTVSPGALIITFDNYTSASVLLDALKKTMGPFSSSGERIA